MSSNTDLCNQALGRIGANQIKDLDTDTSPQAIQCRLHFEPTKDSLLRTHWWRFASTRATLELNAETPDFEWNFQFDLPEDFSRMKSIWEDRTSDINYRNYALEGDLLLTNESTMSIKYVKKVTDPTEFDDLFVEVLVLTLAKKLVGPLAGANAQLTEQIKDDLKPLMSTVRTIDAQETNTSGVIASQTWNDARFSGRSNDPSKY